MRRVSFALGVLASALPLGAGFAHAQARGPSHAQTREKGLHITGKTELMELSMEQAREHAEQERIALQDPEERARRFTALDALLRRLPGRFRIEGRIERLGSFKKEGDVRGVADCSAVGASAGVNCIINATWPILEPLVPINAPGARPAVSEQLRTMHPAVLVVGLNIDPPGVRAMMVTSDTLASNWVGQLDDEGATLTRPSRCWTDPRCYRTFQIVPGPDSTVTSFVLVAAGYSISLVLYPDPKAEPPGSRRK